MFDTAAASLTLDLSPAETEYLLRALRMPALPGHQFDTNLTDGEQEAVLTSACQSLLARGLIAFSVDDGDTPSLVVDKTTTALVGTFLVAKSSLMLVSTEDDLTQISMLFHTPEGAILYQNLPLGIKRFTTLLTGDSIVAALLDALRLDPLKGHGELLAWSLPEYLWATPKELDFEGITAWMPTSFDLSDFAGEVQNAASGSTRRYIAGTIQGVRALDGAILETPDSYWIVSNDGSGPVICRGGALQIISLLTSVLRASVQ